MTVDRRSESDRTRPTSRAPTDSFFYERVVPGLLIALAVITVLFIIVALGVFVGIVPYR